MDSATNKRPTRRNTRPIKVCCPPEMRQEIETAAKASGLSMSRYLLNVGLGYEIPSLAHHKAVEELAKINGDLGRLGGLLKLWLTDDVRAAQVGTSTIRAALTKIEANQRQMTQLMKQVLFDTNKAEL